MSLTLVTPGMLPADPPDWVAAFGITRSFVTGTAGPVTVTYALAESGTNPWGQAYRPLTDAEVATIELSIARLTRDSGLQLVEAPAGQAQMLIGASSDTAETAYGRTWMSTTGPVHVVAYDHPYDSPDGLARNTYIYLHELMHGVGLNHSTLRTGSTSPVVIPDAEDDGTTLFGNWTVGWNSGVQMFDLAALQYLYGPDPAQRSGNDVYRPDPGAFDPDQPEENIPLLWDGGGHDRIDLSGAAGPVHASLTPGVISQVNTGNTGLLEAGTFAINHNSRFEVLEGSAHDDTLEGSEASDTLIGGAGNDVLSGGATAQDLRDVIYGGAGNDRLHGGAGNDELRGDGGHDRIEGGQGADTLIGGTGNDLLGGGTWGDALFGGDGDDFLNGGFGHDQVNGGAGADRFYHLGVEGHGSDWIQDYDAAEGDVLQFGGTASAADFQVNVTETANAGTAGVEEAFVIYRPTGQILWALVDGGAQDSINLVLNGATHDLLSA